MDCRLETKLYNKHKIVQVFPKKMGGRNKQNMKE